MSPAAVAAEKEAKRGWVDPNSPTYRGPGWAMDENGDVVLPDDPGKRLDQALWENNRNNPVPAPVLPTADQKLDDIDDAAPKKPPPTVNLDTYKNVGNGYGTPPALRGASRPRATVTADQFRANVDTTGFTSEPAPGAPVTDRSRIDPLLDSLNTTEQKLLALADETRGMSAAEAALHKASKEANIRSAIAVEATQRGALGAARGARNRGDRALLERQAVGEQSFIGQEQARTDSLRLAEQEGSLAQLRATEEQNDLNFKASIYEKAIELGLNKAALEVDISKVDMQSATNFINNEFAAGESDKVLDQRQAEMVLGFTKDMATLQYEYDKLSVEDQNATDALLMQKYGIDQGTMLALKQMKDGRKMDWNGIFTNLIAGAASGGTAALAAASDERLKHEIADVDTDELEELLSAVKSETWRYKDDDEHGGGTRGKRLGPMTQDLKKSKLGKSMVVTMPDGFDGVDTGRAGLAALSGLALVYDKLQQLEGNAS